MNPSQNDRTTPLRTQPAPDGEVVVRSHQPPLPHHQHFGGLLAGPAGRWVHHELGDSRQTQPGVGMIRLEITTDFPPCCTCIVGRRSGMLAVGVYVVVGLFGGDVRPSGPEGELLPTRRTAVSVGRCGACGGTRPLIRPPHRCRRRLARSRQGSRGLVK